jgi:hypothetical protein
MNDHTFIRNLEINRKSESPSNLDKKDEKGIEKNRVSVQVLILDELLGKALSNALSEFQFPFRKVDLKCISILNAGNSVSDIIPLIKDNLSNRVKTLVVGGHSSGFKACFDTLQFQEKFFNTTIVQNSAGTDIDNLLIEVKRPWLKGIFIVGNQAHLSDSNYLARVEMEGLRCIRLGAMRSEPGIPEPEIRSSDLFGLSLNSLKQCEAPIQTKVSSTGLTSEEACQLCYYAGRAERNQVAGIFDFMPSAGTNPGGINLMATLIWYYLHGLNLRSSAYPPSKKTMKKFTLEQTVDSKFLTFYKDEKEQKWWLESPFKKHVLSKEMPLIACDYQDYKFAANDQLLTERLLTWFHLYESGGLMKDSF